jgi:hypothetical protein
MRIAPMTRVAGHGLRAVREYARVREISVDLPYEQDPFWLTRLRSY